ncbi:MAG: TGS domain-containing protein, partial [Bacteroidota bacterium]
KKELEDLHFRFTQPQTHKLLQDKVEAQYQKQEQYFYRFQAAIAKQLEHLKLAYTLKSRVKGLFSIWNKMTKQGVSFEEVYDLFALRIILHNVPLAQEKAVCWQVYLHLTDLYKPHPRRTRNWVSLPKASGYESLHVTLQDSTRQWIEVQVRTQRMDEVAEQGYAAHWRYKNVEATSAVQKAAWLGSIRSLIVQEATQSLTTKGVDIQEEQPDAHQTIVLLADDTVKMLPTGSTVLDLAFMLGDTVGQQCTGAHVNGKLVPPYYTLQNSDQVALHSRSTQKVHEAWRNWVTTRQAKASIEGLLRTQRGVAIDTGKRILQRQRLYPAHDTALQHQLCAFFDTAHMDELYYQLGEDIISVQALQKFAVANPSLKQKQTTTPRPKQPRTFRSLKAMRQQEDNAQQLVVMATTIVPDCVLGTCCRPTAADAIVAYTNAQGIVEVHKQGCVHIAEIQQQSAHAVHDVQWNTQPYPLDIQLRIETSPRPRQREKLLSVIAQEQSVILKSMHSNSQQHATAFKTTISLKRPSALQKILQKIEQIEGVMHIKPPTILC